MDAQAVLDAGRTENRKHPYVHPVFPMVDSKIWVKCGKSSVSKNFQGDISVMPPLEDARRHLFFLTG